MKTIQTKTAWSRRIGFYLLSLAVLALFGWSEGAIWLAAFAGGIALLIWWIAGLGWVAVTNTEELNGMFPDTGGEFTWRQERLVSIPSFISLPPARFARTVRNGRAEGALPLTPA